MEKICVNLYGGKSIFGGREQPLEAEILYCSCKEKCSLYKENKCINCGILATSKCPKGLIVVDKGYTSKAMKYRAFKEKYTKDETYNKLDAPISTRFAVMDNDLWFDLRYVRVYKPNEDSVNYEKRNEWGYFIDKRNYNKKGFLMPYEEINVDFIHQICSCQPITIGNNMVNSYKTEIVSVILEDMKKLVPEIYNQLIEKYPEYEELKPNYVGRYAYTKTLKDGSEIVDCHGNKGILKNGEIHCNSFTKGFVPFGGSTAKVVVQVKDTDTYKVTDNSQVDENTRFK